MWSPPHSSTSGGTHALYLWHDKLSAQPADLVTCPDTALIPKHFLVKLIVHSIALPCSTFSRAHVCSFAASMPASPPLPRHLYTLNWTLPPLPQIIPSATTPCSVIDNMTNCF